MTARDGHWEAHARQWARLGAPLRPSPADVATYARIVDERRPRRALLLGATPEIARLATYPAGATLVAADRAPAVLHAVFPRADAVAIPHARVVADWCALPLADASIELALGDGCLTTLAYPHGVAAFARELARVLAPGGALVLRLFAAPTPRETLADVGRALARGEIGSLHALKWRLAMAAPHGDTIAVADILAAFDRVVPDRAALVRATGWDPDGFATIDAYRNSPHVYAFPTEAAQLAALAPAFAPIARSVGDYELAERCPIVVLRRA